MTWSSSPTSAKRVSDGEAAVEVQVLEPTAEVVLNAADLEVHQARLVGAGARSVEVTVDYRPEEEQLVLGAPETLAPGPWRLELRFSGRLNDRLRGFYRSKFRAQTAKRPGWRQRSSSPPTPAGPSRAGTNPTCKAIFEVTLIVDRGRRRFLQRPDRPTSVGGRQDGAPASPPPCRCPPTWWPSSSARFELDRDDRRGRRPSAHRLHARA